MANNRPAIITVEEGWNEIRTNVSTDSSAEIELSECYDHYCSAALFSVWCNQSLDGFNSGGAEAVLNTFPLYIDPMTRGGSVIAAGYQSGLLVIFPRHREEAAFFDVRRFE